jgi:hypothetical protein
MILKARSSDGEPDRAAERAARLGAISTADTPSPNYELFHDVAFFPSPPVPPL